MEKIAFFRENLLSLLSFLWGTMLHSTFHMTAVVKHSISFYQPFFSDVNSWGWSPLLLTVSHTRIWWLQLGFGELALQGVLPWPFLFIWPAVFVSNLLLAKWVLSNGSGQAIAPTLMSLVLIGFSTSAPAPLTCQHSAFLFLLVLIYTMIYQRCEPFSTYPGSC